MSVMMKVFLGFGVWTLGRYHWMTLRHTSCFYLRFFMIGILVFIFSGCIGIADITDLRTYIGAASQDVTKISCQVENHCYQMIYNK
jgi:hypothetical protein